MTVFAHALWVVASIAVALFSASTVMRTFEPFGASCSRQTGHVLYAGTVRIDLISIIARPLRSLSPSPAKR